MKTQAMTVGSAVCTFVAAILETGSASGSVTPIFKARNFPEGTLVTIQGAVTVPSGLFSSFTSDAGFALQGWVAGIYVSTEVDLELPLGARVRVTGELRDDGFGNLTLRVGEPQLVRRRRGRRRVRPRRIVTAAVERNQGTLVRVAGCVTRPIRDDRPFGFGILLDDGSGEIQVFVPTSTGIDPTHIAGLEAGAFLEATGLSVQFDTFREVVPRTEFDLRVMPPNAAPACLGA